MLKVGVFVDIPNQVAALAKHCKGHRIDYRKYLELLEQDEKLIWKANAYGKFVSDDGISFIQVLTTIGYHPSFMRVKTLEESTNRSVEIALDIVDAHAKLDIVVLGSNAEEFIPLIKWLRSKSVRVWVVTPFLTHEEGDRSVDLLHETGIIEPIHVLKEKSSGTG